MNKLIESQKFIAVTTHHKAGWFWNQSPLVTLGDGLDSVASGFSGDYAGAIKSITGGGEGLGALAREGVKFANGG